MAATKVISNALSFIPQGYLFGLTMSTAGSSATMSIAAGIAADSTGTRLMKLGATMAKTTSAWAAGTAAGGLDTGAIANSTWYHFFEIMNPATGAVDVVFSATATPANGPTTLPTGYTLFRRIGAGKTNGSAQWTSFIQYEDEFLWLTPVIDSSAITASTTAISKALTVPTGVKIWAKFNGLLVSSGNYVHFYALDRGTQASSATTNFSLACGVTSQQSASDFAIRTDTSAQIGIVCNNATGSYYISTHGWIDTRGRNT